LYEPASQLPDGTNSPEALQNMPTGHDKQLIDPLEPWYVPAPHNVHAACPLPLYDPGEHWLHEVAPALDDKPAAHGKQLLDPIKPWNVPAPHGVHIVCPLPL
jgi:hypothetical protein